ncbi:ADP-ribosyltransferase [Neobacillus vireti]|uniref:ADP-ribosyltransferase n=1 Tax=Neobacillus vireti TaxID=220686 RepID=UPI002FFE736C
MKRDLKINYGILDHIIGQLYMYNKALDGMHTSLSNISVFIESNSGESIDAWDKMIKNSKENIKSYKTQIKDLLSLFENYVTDTTAYIRPIARNAIMRVDRNDIWVNLDQIETGILNNVSKALKLAHKTPASFISFIDPTEQEKQKSEENKAKMKNIRYEIEVSKNRLEKYMSELWDLYDSKIVKFENTDDAYNYRAAQIKDKYTTFFEGTVDIVEIIIVGAWDLIEGLGVGLNGIIEGTFTFIVDSGVVIITVVLPDVIVPDFIIKEADETIDEYTKSFQQLVNDPWDFLVESPFQSFTDTVEEEGIMYGAGISLSAIVAKKLFNKKKDNNSNSEDENNKGSNSNSEDENNEGNNPTSDDGNSEHDNSTSNDENSKDNDSTSDNGDNEVDREKAVSDTGNIRSIESIEQAHAWGEKHFDEWFNSLTNLEKQALYSYTNYSFAKINDYLRGKTTSLDGINPNRITEIQNALKKAKIPEDMVVYRGTGLTLIKKLLPQYKNKKFTNAMIRNLIGKEFKDDAFLSTSVVKESSFSNRSVFWTINVPKGANGAYLGKISYLETETEILFNSGQQMIIRDALVDSKGQIHLVVDLINK